MNNIDFLFLLALIFFCIEIVELNKLKGHKRGMFHLSSKLETAKFQSIRGKFLSQLWTHVQMLIKCFALLPLITRTMSFVQKQINQINKSWPTIQFQSFGENGQSDRFSLTFDFVCQSFDGEQKDKVYRSNNTWHF